MDFNERQSRMSSKPKSRPPVLDLGSMMVTKPAAMEAPTAAQVVEQLATAKPAKGEAAMFRTSVYFPRAVHDKLRAIAFEERKTVTDLINEGLDQVLTSRNYPTTAELREKGIKA